MLNKKNPEECHQIGLLRSHELHEMNLHIISGTVII